jgi:hypothetical protein
VTTRVADFSETLREAIAESRAAGLDASVDELEGKVLAAYTTSSEYLGEVGKAISSFLEQHDRALPSSTVARFHHCLAEVGKVWPKYRP